MAKKKNKKSEEEIDASLQELGDALAEIVGATSAAAVGQLVNGLPGVLVAAAAGQTVTVGLRHLLQTVNTGIHMRQTQRRDRTILLAVKGLQARLVTGAQLRADGFFEEDEGQSSSAAQLIEGVLLRAVTEFEERKLPYIANIYGNTAVSGVPPADAYYVLKLLGDITYRGLVCLAVIGRVAELHLSEEPFTAHSVSATTSSILAELMSLTRHDLIGQGRDQLYDTNKVLSIRASGDISPAHLLFDPLGATAYRLMGLDAMPLSELEAVAQHLRVSPLATGGTMPAPPPQQETGSQPDQNVEAGGS